jgi:hypothetical protein
MSLDLVRMRFAAVAAKIETTPGLDAIAGTPVNADWLAADCEIDFDPITVENNELTGSLDRSPAIVGGLGPRPAIAFASLRRRPKPPPCGPGSATGLGNSTLAFSWMARIARCFWRSSEEHKNERCLFPPRCGMVAELGDSLAERNRRAIWGAVNAPGDEAGTSRDSFPLASRAVRMVERV